jgi:hypothetical protein
MCKKKTSRREELPLFLAAVFRLITHTRSFAIARARHRSRPSPPKHLGVWHLSLARPPYVSSATPVTLTQGGTSSSRKSKEGQVNQFQIVRVAAASRFHHNLPWAVVPQLPPPPRFPLKKSPPPPPPLPLRKMISAVVVVALLRVSGC